MRSEHMDSLAEKEAKQKILNNEFPLKDANIDLNQNESFIRPIEDRLEHLKGLLDRGLITEEEAGSTKAKLLNDR
ncbi:hypothetical protein OAC78_08265 [Litorivicinus sp.]|nr:hypothetical protein [Litorivicinus sp.]